MKRKKEMEDLEMKGRQKDGVSSWIYIVCVRQGLCSRTGVQGIALCCKFFSPGFHTYSIRSPRNRETRNCKLTNHKEELLWVHVGSGRGVCLSFYAKHTTVMLTDHTQARCEYNSSSSQQQHYCPKRLICFCLLFCSLWGFLWILEGLGYIQNGNLTFM